MDPNQPICEHVTTNDVVDTATAIVHDALQEKVCLIQTLFVISYTQFFILRILTNGNEQMQGDLLIKFATIMMPTMKQLYDQLKYFEPAMAAIGGEVYANYSADLDRIKGTIN